MPTSFLSRIHEIFNHRALRKVFLKLRVPLGVAFFLLILTQLEEHWFFPGLIVAILGQMLQVWCMSTIKTQKKLTVTGPYMFVRNPMYLGRFFLILGVLVMTGNPWILIPFTVAYYLYMVNRVRREEKVLAELFGEDYEAFRRDVRPYLPGFKRFDPRKLWSFNRESIHQNNVMTNIFLPIVGYIVLYLVTFVWPLPRLW